MRRIKAIFSALRILGRNPHNDIRGAWVRISTALSQSPSADDFRLIEQIVFGAMDEAEAYMKRQGEQVDKDPPAT
jgi:hypothetical protein